jgi:hypothetical protein
MNRLFEAIANDEVLSVGGAELGITWRKVSQYLGLFCFLLALFFARRQVHRCGTAQRIPVWRSDEAAVRDLPNLGVPFRGAGLPGQDLALQRCRWESLSVQGWLCILAFRSNMTDVVNILLPSFSRWSRLSFVRSLLTQLRHFADQENTTT